MRNGLAILLLLLAAPAALAAKAPPRTAETGTTLTEDAGLSVSVRIALLRTLGAPALDVGVAATGARIQLSGRVPDPDLKARAAQIAGAMPGVGWVENEIHVAPPLADEPARGDRAEELRNALIEAQIKGEVLRRFGAHSLRLAVGVRDGVASLAGAVASDKDRDALVGAALHVPGVMSVSNELRVDRSLRKVLVD